VVKTQGNGHIGTDANSNAAIGSEADTNSSTGNRLESSETGSASQKLNPVESLTIGQKTKKF
jgi:hypothetical protein